MRMPYRLDALNYLAATTTTTLPVTTTTKTTTESLDARRLFLEWSMSSFDFEDYMLSFRLFNGIRLPLY